jgi:rhodanese-related sulfurtransferase
MRLPFEISVVDYAALRGTPQAPILLDVREPEEYAIAQIPGSILLPLGEITTKARLVLPDLSAHIVVHCHHGMRSARAAEYFIKIGYSQIQNLTGGIDAWSAEIDPSVPAY